MLTPTHTARAALITLCVISITLLLSPTAIADSHCRVQLSREWAQGMGKGTLLVRNVGKPCGAALYTDPQANTAVDSIKVIIQPKNGIVEVVLPRFHYTPNDGFTGPDRFALIAEGPSRDGRQRITLKGEITVQVTR